MWISYNPNPVALRTDDCSPRALSAALETSWETAHLLLDASALEMGLMPSNKTVMAAVLRKQGFLRAVIPDTCPDCYTVSDFCREHPAGVYVLGCGDHVVTVTNGNIMDTWDSSQEVPLMYWYREGKK